MSAPDSHAPAAKAGLALGSVGVVYGDIGTSPLYALREGLAAAAEGAAPDPEAVTGIVSLLLWMLILIATLKYVLLILRADNRGEGGTLSLLALCQRAFGGRKMAVLGLGIVGTALFFGDAMITPAISVLSAVEGAVLIAPAVEPYVVPATIAILFALFWVQSRGTGRISRFFGPVMLVWFLTMGGMGLWHIMDAPRILAAFNPIHGIGYLVLHGTTALPVLAAVFLAITGAEALYADMGHFGREPIRMAWFGLVFPCLALAYLGQGALVIAHPETARDPFFLMASETFLPLLVAMATLATVIASQAVITGAFSVARQAVQLGLLPRLTVLHTSTTQEGQVYLPQINGILLVTVVMLVMTFRSSANLATAYGIAVTGEMIVTTFLAAFVFRKVWGWSPGLIALVVIPLLLIEGALFSANLTKFANGGYLPITVAAVLAIVMWTWVRGTAAVETRARERAVPLEVLARSLAGSDRLARAPGTAVFLSQDPVATPSALAHNLKHNQTLHAQNLVVSVRIANRPTVDEAERAVVTPLDENFTRIRLTFGYMDDPNVPRAIRAVVPFDIMATSFFLSRRSFRVGGRDGWPLLQKRLYRTLTAASSSAFEYFHLPADRVVEVGQQNIL
ncbi:potassium transporter Kup [Jannaschia pohangensis]|uniref:Probable potassium transport system protein Kup n=1 Tax=Jannaschia pohangensis TaxID=390807 RepID=A0A1I3JBI4_9RHOB|nr:potassium transporter Kup [Jannaschia pohangensis]SFI57583.1 KUP system potassium uptake protein [Jannaschia pohangensis]